MSDIDRILLEMEKRGLEYFDDTMRLGRVMDLLNRSRMQQGFENNVVADAPQQIERRVSELVDWLVELVASVVSAAGVATRGDVGSVMMK